jgi:hypothetical protein
MAEPTVRDILKKSLVGYKKQAVKPYAKELRKYAEENSTWPMSLINQISAKYEEDEDGGHHPITYPEPIKDDVLILENGKPGQAPSAMLRNFMLEHR